MLDRTQRPAVNALADFEMQKPERMILPNGITLNLLPAGDEEVVRMDVLIGAAIWQQTLPLQALFTNRMLREGTRSMDSATISERLDFYGAWVELSTSINCNFLTLYSLNRHFAHTLSVVSEMLKAPIFPEHEMRVTVEANRQQFLINSTKVDVMARKEFSKAIFGSHHPCGHHAELEDYGRLNVEHLSTFYNQYYHSGNCSIYLSGKITDEIIALIEKELGSQPWGNVAPQAPFASIPVPPYEGRRINVEHPTAVQSAIRLGCPMVARTHEDFIPLKVLVTVLGGYFGSRLMTNVREEKGYTYGINAFVASYPFHGYLTIASETDNEYVEPCIKEIKKEMKTLQENLIHEKELSMVKNYMMGELYRTYEGPFALSDAWIFIETAGLDDEFFTRMSTQIRQVTSNQLQELACNYFQPDNLLEVVAGKKV